MRIKKGMWRALGVTLFALAMSFAAKAQQPSPQNPENTDSSLPSAPQPAGNPPATDQTKPDQNKTDAATKPTTPAAAGVHRFWDRENDLLFTAVGAGRALDYASTLNLRSRGINEAFLTNSIVDNHPLFAGIEAAATGASIGVSYIFHRTGHHRLERWTSVIHAGIAVGGAIRNYNLKSPR